MQEVAARGGRIILIGDAKGAAAAGLDTLATVTMPDLDPVVAPIVYAVPIQLIRLPHRRVHGERRGPAPQPREVGDGGVGGRLARPLPLVAGRSHMAPHRHSGSPQASPGSRAADGVKVCITCVSGSRAPLRGPGMTGCCMSDFGKVAGICDRPALVGRGQGWGWLGDPQAAEASGTTPTSNSSPQGGGGPRRANLSNRIAMKRDEDAGTTPAFSVPGAPQRRGRLCSPFRNASTSARVL